MDQNAFKYSFEKSVDIGESEATLLVALIAVEALHGASAMRMHARYHFDPDQRACEIDAGSEVGLDLNRIYLGFLNREFGHAAFQVQRVTIESVSV